MEHLPPDGIGCDMCSASFRDEVELATHKKSHGANRIEDAVARSDTPDAGSQGPRESLGDNPGATAPNEADESTEEARAERDVVEGQRSDQTNDLANRANIGNYRDDSEWEVNPDQTPKPAKTIRPIPYV